MSVYTPTVRVEMAFGLGPYDVVAGGDWVDVSSDAFACSIRRGRPSEFELHPASTASISLHNDQRQWDPLNAAGAHYGDLTVNVPVRVVAEISSVDYPLFRGFVDGWPIEYTEGGYSSTVQLSCTDAFKLLAERPIPDTHEAFLDTFGAPVAWFRMDSTRDQLLANSGPKGRDGNVIAPLDIVASITPACLDGAISMPEQQPAIDDQTAAATVPILVNSDNLTEEDSWSVAVTVQFAKTGYHGLFSTYPPDSLGAVVSLYVTDSNTGAFYGGNVFYVVSTPGATIIGHGYVDVQDGRPHRVVLCRNSIQTTLYVDGLLANTAFDVSATSWYDCAGGRHMIGISSIGDGVTISPAVVLDELMLFDRGLSAAEVTALDAELVAGFSALRSTGDAIDDILDLIGWPAALRDIDPGEVQVQLPVNPTGTSTLKLLQSITQSEGGRLFIGADGSIVFHDRGRFLRETVENTVQYTFTDNNRDTTPSDVGLLDGTLSLVLDDKQVYDAATVTRVNGIAQTSTAVNPPARTYQASGLLYANDAQALSLAQWVTFRYGTAQVRSDAWKVDPEIVAGDWPDLLTLDIGHRIKLDLTPGEQGASINLEQHLELIGHDITPEAWQLTLNGAPVDPADYFLWASVVTASSTHGWSTGGSDGGYWG